MKSLPFSGLAGRSWSGEETEEERVAGAQEPRKTMGKSSKPYLMRPRIGKIGDSAT